MSWQRWVRDPSPTAAGSQQPALGRPEIRPEDNEQLPALPGISRGGDCGKCGARFNGSACYECSSGASRRFQRALQDVFMGSWPRVRREILAAGCLCGLPAEYVGYVLERWQGGTQARENLVGRCEACLHGLAPDHPKREAMRQAIARGQAKRRRR